MVIIMNETYVEWLVKRKTPAYMAFLKILFTVLAVFFVLIGLLLLPALSAEWQPILLH